MKATDGNMRILMLQICKAFSESFNLFHHLKLNPLKCGWQKWEKEESMRLSILNLLSPELCKHIFKEGYFREWNNQRLQAIQDRKELTDAWQDHGVEAEAVADR